MSTNANRLSSAAPCFLCGGTDTRLVWQTFQDQRRHLRLECGGCAKFVKYVRQTPVNLATADGLAATPTATDDAGVLLVEVRQLTDACRRKAAESPNLHRRLALVLDLAGDAVRAGDREKLKRIYTRLWRWAESQEKGEQ